MSHPIVVDVALDDDDAPVLGLSAGLARATGARRSCPPHALPYQPLIAAPPPEHQVRPQITDREQ